MLIYKYTFLIFVYILPQFEAQVYDCYFAYPKGGYREFSCPDDEDCCGDVCCKPKFVWWPYLVGGIALLLLGICLYMLYDYCKKGKKSTSVQNSFASQNHNTLQAQGSNTLSVEAGDYVRRGSQISTNSMSMYTNRP